MKLENVYSRFNYEMSYKDKIAVFNTYSGRVMILENDEFLFMKKNPNDYLNEVNDSLKAQLVKSGFFVDTKFDEIEAAKKKYYENCDMKEIFTLTLIPTTECNLKCPYCFITRDSKFMSDQVIKNTKERIGKLLNDKKNELKLLNIKWFGGEPLLRKEIIDEISEYLIDICTQYDIEYRAVLYTNLTHVNIKDIEFFKRNKITKTNITIDDYLDANDFRRPSKNGTSTFNTIIDNILFLKNDTFINIQTNIDKKNALGIKTLINFLKSENILEKGKVEIGFSFINDNSFIEDKNNFIEFTDANYMKIINEYYRLLGSYTTINLPKSNGVPCFLISKNTLTIGPDGILYKCYNDPTTSISVGNIQNQSNDFEVILNQVRYREDGLSDECIQCELFPICMGGCRVMNKDKQCVMKYTLAFRIERFLDNKLVNHE